MAVFDVVTLSLVNRLLASTSLALLLILYAESAACTGSGGRAVLPSLPPRPLRFVLQFKIVTEYGANQEGT